MLKTVLDLDLAGYRTIAERIQSEQSAAGIWALKEQVQGFVNHGLSTVGAARSEAVVAMTGDGAILVLAEPEQAHQFAQAVHKAAQEHNSRRTGLEERHFHIGAATGEIDL